MVQDPAVTPTGTPLHRALGLTDDEAARIEEILERAPNELELAMYAVMWSEHCSYKSSRAHLGRLPSQAPWVMVGPGENAGVVDCGDGLAVAVRIESHNHPSAIEPYQGAATGVGGILRDIFTMGARPIALLDSLHFGPLDNPHSRWVAEGVVSGISGYGNSVGVPTVGGELHFADCFADNPLVNVMAVGVLRHEHLVLARAEGVGNHAVLIGSTTGRDGIGGVSVLASAGFKEGEEAKRPSVQVGDPFEEKRLIEACLSLYEAGLVAGIQDLGGAGITCATSEIAARGGMGMDVDLRTIPLRMTGMVPAEIMTSESQERMLAIVAPDDLEAVLGLCRKWEVRATVIGTVTDTGQLRILDGPGPDAPVLADVPAHSLEQGAPKYHRPLREPADRAARQADDPARLPPPPGNDCGPDLLAMLADTSAVWSQYDHQLFLNTVEGPGGDATVLRLKAPGLPITGKGIALSADSNSRWCDLDPRRGTALVVAEAALNLACVGARPLALVDNLNFGNPEHPEVMWQLSETIDGMAEACLALSLPVVGGNVSLYNESGGRDIHPTPVVGTVGLIDVLDRRPPGARLVDGADIFVLGTAPTAPTSLAGSRWAANRGHLGGPLPTLDLEAHARLCEVVRGLVEDHLLAGVHDVSDGGAAVALAEMAIASGVGFHVDFGGHHAALFSEAPSRVLLCLADAESWTTVLARAEVAGLTLAPMGTAGGDRLVVEGLLDLPLAQVNASWRDALPGRLAGLVS
ncbi:MAG: phosphoribosylformylglycinamidine synthase subunit PurL [Actinomycetota bacterium]|nr:phosphoribosylformylglycinamidine synthase subunit PurL [Actinomycetota bacterium]